MANIVPVSASHHAGKAWRRPASYAFAAPQALVPLVAPEFPKAALAMPIAFIEQAGQYVPVGLMSPLAGRNFFIGPAGQWLGTYVPAALRGYPFRLGRVEGSEELALCIDEDSGLIVDADARGRKHSSMPTGSTRPASKAMLDFLVAMEHSRMSTELAVKTLAEAGLIEPWQLQVKAGRRHGAGARAFPPQRGRAERA